MKVVPVLNICLLISIQRESYNRQLGLLMGLLHLGPTFKTFPFILAHSLIEQDNFILRFYRVLYGTAD